MAALAKFSACLTSLPLRMRLANVYASSVFSFVQQFYLMPSWMAGIVKRSLINFVMGFCSVSYDGLIFGPKILGINDKLDCVFLRNFSAIARVCPFHDFDIDPDLPGAQMLFSFHRKAVLEEFEMRGRTPQQLLHKAQYGAANPDVIYEKRLSIYYKFLYQADFLGGVGDIFGKKLAKFGLHDVSDRVKQVCSASVEISRPLPPKFFLSTFQLICNSWPTKARLKFRNELSGPCVFCGGAEDRVEHFFSDCPIIKSFCETALGFELSFPKALHIDVNTRVHRDIFTAVHAIHLFHNDILYGSGGIVSNKVEGLVGTFDRLCSGRDLKFKRGTTGVRFVEISGDRCYIRKVSPPDPEQQIDGVLKFMDPSGCVGTWTIAFDDLDLQKRLGLGSLANRKSKPKLISDEDRLRIQRFQTLPDQLNETGVLNDHVLFLNGSYNLVLGKDESGLQLADPDCNIWHVSHEVAQASFLSDSPIVIYVDGSYDPDWDVSSWGVSVMGYTRGQVFDFSSQICIDPNDIEFCGATKHSSMNGELVAMYKAITMVDAQVCIKLVYDCQSARVSICGDNHPSSSPVLVNECRRILCGRNGSTEWYKEKSHVGWLFNERVDRVAKFALFGDGIVPGPGYVSYDEFVLSLPPC